MYGNCVCVRGWYKSWFFKIMNVVFLFYFYIGVRKNYFYLRNKTKMLLCGAENNGGTRSASLNNMLGHIVFCKITSRGWLYLMPVGLMSDRHHLCDVVSCLFIWCLSLSVNLLFVVFNRLNTEDQWDRVYGVWVYGRLQYVSEMICVLGANCHCCLINSNLLVTEQIYGSNDSVRSSWNDWSVILEKLIPVMFKWLIAVMTLRST